VRIETRRLIQVDVIGVQPTQCIGKRGLHRGGQRVVPEPRAIVAMLSASSACPYIPDIPMQPSPTAETCGPPFPSVRVCMALL
jgi:hypothetical protein